MARTARRAAMRQPRLALWFPLEALQQSACWVSVSVFLFIDAAAAVPPHRARLLEVHWRRCAQREPHRTQRAGPLAH